MERLRKVRALLIMGILFIVIVVAIVMAEMGYGAYNEEDIVQVEWKDMSRLPLSLIVFDPMGDMYFMDDLMTFSRLVVGETYVFEVRHCLLEACPKKVQRVVGIWNAEGYAVEI